MLRLLAVLLVLANAAFLAWTQGWLGGLLAPPATQSEREPERLQRQVQPDTLRLLPAQAASAALAAAAASATEAAPSAVASTRCLQTGFLGASDVATAEKLLRDAGVAAAGIKALAGERGGVFLIYMGRYSDREALLRKIDELKRLKIDAEELRNAADLQPGLTLGRFTDRTVADVALNDLTQRGLRTARVIVMTPPAVVQALRVAAADAALAARLAALKLPAGAAFTSCSAE